jgi:hypothetical protein
VVLDAKAMEWAAANGIDTAKLKAAKVPVYGKWYFPEIPAGVPLVNLKSGEIQTFGPGLRAGEVLFVARADLRRARLGPYAEGAAAESLDETAPPSVSAPPVEAPARPQHLAEDQSLGPGEAIHLPGPSIFPLVFGLGLSVALVGLVAGPIEVRILIVLLGLLYLLAGGAGWAVENYRDREAAAGHGAGPGSPD